MTVDQLLGMIFNAALTVAVIATVMSLGMGLTVKQLVAPLRRVWVVLLMILLNAVLVPLLAWFIAGLFPLDQVYKDGIVLCAIATSGPSSIKAAQLSRRADLPLTISLVVILQLVSIIAMPFWAAQVVSGASISPSVIVQNLLVMVLIPLIIGLFIKARYAEHATEWAPGLIKIGNAALLIGLVTGIVANVQTILGLLGSWALLVSLIIIVVSAALGMLIGFKDPTTRLTTGFVSGIRFTSLGMIIIGTQLSSNPGYLAAAITFALIDFIVPMVVAVEIGRKAAAPSN